MIFTASYPLPPIELCLYFAIWTAHSLMAFLISINATKRKVGHWLDHWLEPSSYVNGLRIDNSDIEWKLFRTACRVTISAFLLHSVVFKMMICSRHIPQRVGSLFLIIFWLSLHISWSTPQCIILIALFMIISIMITAFIKRQWFVWIFALFFIAKISDYVSFSLDPAKYYREFNLYLYSAIKVVNICIYLVKSQRKINFNLSLEFAEYMLYPPYSIAIIVLFEDFQKQKILANNKAQNFSCQFYNQILKRALRLIFSFLLLELLLHLCYVNALFNSPFTMFYNFNNYEVASIAYVAGHLFHLKYVIIFGLPSVFATIDGMSPPESPVCIAHVSKYSNMWRHFDRGLYAFLKHQVYIPLINQITWAQSIQLRRLFAMFPVFIFILIWHGMNSNYFWWVSLSVLELLIERFGADIIWQSPIFQQILLPKLSTAFYIRLKAIVMLALVIPGIFGIFFFLSSGGVGDYIFKNLLIKGLVQIFTLNIHFNNSGWVLSHLLLMGYAFNHCCLYIEEWQRNSKIILNQKCSKDLQKSL